MNASCEEGEKNIVHPGFCEVGGLESSFPCLFARGLGIDVKCGDDGYEDGRTNQYQVSCEDKSI
jgi:hypothetical protein